MLNGYVGNVGELGYLNLLQDILDNGQDVMDRTGVGTRSVFGRQLRFDLTKGFPLLTTKRIHRKSVIHESIWFLSGDTNVKYLNDNGVTIWDEWAREDGDLGPVYGKQWRSWEHVKMEGAFLSEVRTIDQIANVVESLSTNPHSRRHIVSAWNPAEVDGMALPPCHTLFQFYVRNIPYETRRSIAAHKNVNPVDSQLDYFAPKYYLDCQLFARSQDTLLGTPFNIASYSLLIHMMAQQLNMLPGEFVLSIGDAHIYKNHFDAVAEQLSRRDKIQEPPQLTILRKPDSIFDYKYEYFKFTNYKPLPNISAPIAV